MVVRENTEGLYAGLENKITPGVMVSSKIATEKAYLRIANPLACIMSGVMMLQHIQENEAAKKIEKAYEAVLSEGNPENLTGDIGGKSTTRLYIGSEPLQITKKPDIKYEIRFQHRKEHQGSERFEARNFAALRAYDPLDSSPFEFYLSVLKDFEIGR